MNTEGINPNIQMYRLENRPNVTANLWQAPKNEGFPANSSHTNS